MSDNPKEVKNIRYIGLNGGSPNPLLTNDQFVGCITSQGIVQAILPPISAYGGQIDNIELNISDFSSNAATNHIIVYASGGNKINGASSIIIESNNGTGRFIPISQNDWGYTSSEIAPVIGSFGTFNTTGLGGNFFYNLQNEDLLKFFAVSIQGATKGTKLGVIGGIYTLESVFLQQWSVNGVVDVPTLHVQNCPLVEEMAFYPTSGTTPPSGVMTTATFSNCPVLQSLLITPSVGTQPLANVTIADCPSLKNVQFPTAALTLASVDGILAYLDSTGVTGGTLVLNGGTSSAPTGGGANPNLVSLTGKGWTIAVN
jgi:hypothetical protein